MSLQRIRGGEDDPRQQQRLESGGGRQVQLNPNTKELARWMSETKTAREDKEALVRNAKSSLSEMSSMLKTAQRERDRLSKLSHDKRAELEEMKATVIALTEENDALVRGVKSVAANLQRADWAEEIGNGVLTYLSTQVESLLSRLARLEVDQKIQIDEQKMLLDDINCRLDSQNIAQLKEEIFEMTNALSVKNASVDAFGTDLHLVMRQVSALCIDVSQKDREYFRSKEQDYDNLHSINSAEENILRTQAREFLQYLNDVVFTIGTLAEDMEQKLESVNRKVSELELEHKNAEAKSTREATFDAVRVDEMKSTHQKLKRALTEKDDEKSRFQIEAEDMVHDVDNKGKDMVKNLETEIVKLREGNASVEIEISCLKKNLQEEVENRKREEMEAKAREEREKKEREAKEKKEREAKERKEKEAKERKEREAKEKIEREARQKVERETRKKKEQEAREKAEKEAREKKEQEAREKAEKEAREKKEQEAREKAAKEAREKLERESRQKFEQEAREKKERELKEKTERELREKTEREAKEKIEQEAREKKEREVKEITERELREKTEKEAKEKIEREAKEKIKQEAREKKEQEAREKKEKKEKERKEREERESRELEEKKREVGKSRKKEEEDKKREETNKKSRIAQEKIKKKAEETSKKTMKEIIKARKMEETPRPEVEEASSKKRGASKKSIFDLDTSSSSNEAEPVSSGSGREKRMLLGVFDLPEDDQPKRPKVARKQYPSKPFAGFVRRPIYFS